MNRTLKILIALLFLNIVVGGLLWLGYARMQDKKQEKIALQKELAVENQKSDKLRALSRTLALAKEDRVALEGYLFDSAEENQIQFLSLLETIGLKTTGATVLTNAFNFTETEPKNIHTELAVSGSWEQLYHLLRIIEVFPTHVVVSRYDISRRGGTGEGKSSTDFWQGTLAFDIGSINITPSK